MIAKALQEFQSEYNGEARKKNEMWTIGWEGKKNKKYKI